MNTATEPTKKGKFYVLADMEGISGIRTGEQVRRQEVAAYAEGCRLMMDEINMVVDALFSHGAGEVYVADTHGGGGQVRISEMDPRAIYEFPACGRMMPAMDETFDGILLIGHHGRAGSGGFLDHTFSSASWFEYSLGGRVLGEIGVEAAWAGHYGVPVIMVSGDEHTSQEAKETLGDVETAIVKWALGRNRARCLSVEAAHSEIRAAIGRALGRLGDFRPFRPETPTVARLVVYRTDFADALARAQGVRRIDPRTVECDVADLLGVRPF